MGGPVIHPFPIGILAYQITCTRSRLIYSHPCEQVYEHNAVEKVKIQQNPIQGRWNKEISQVWK